jgi:hypothetical protein
MPDVKVWVFFYGSFINLDVLRQQGLVPERHEVARLPGFDIRIGPLANLVRSEERCVYGIVATATHAELRRLYDFAREGLGGTYGTGTCRGGLHRPHRGAGQAARLPWLVRRTPGGLP